MKRKLLIMIIIVVMLFGLTPVQAIIPGEDAYQPGLGITSTGILFSDIPETLSPAQIEEAGHIARLREEETGKNTAVFQNEDGTNTMYFFAQDIWYETPQGQKMDYSTEIELQPNGTYIGQSNTKTIVLPNRLSRMGVSGLCNCVQRNGRELAYWGWSDGPCSFRRVSPSLHLT